MGDDSIINPFETVKIVKTVKTVKTILLGEKVFSIDWKKAINNIREGYIKSVDFTDKSALLNILKTDIDYILPLAFEDYREILKHIQIINNINDNLRNSEDSISSNIRQIKILHPTLDTYELLHNKLLFTKYMLAHFPDYIPPTYYLDNILINENIEFPVIYKPMYSLNGSNMRIYQHEIQLRFSNIKKTIIQKFITHPVEYAAYLLCVDGNIINCKIISHSYPKNTIKKSNFPPSYKTVENKHIVDIFAKIVLKLNYNGGMCINFKFNEETRKIDIFEINPRFGGSAFTHNFIKELITIK